MNVDVDENATNDNIIRLTVTLFQRQRWKEGNEWMRALSLFNIFNFSSNHQTSRHEKCKMLIKVWQSIHKFPDEVFKMRLFGISVKL